MKLTNQENKVSELIAFGYSEKEISTALFISENTVHTHARNIRKKIKGRSAVDVARFYILNNPKKFFIATMLLFVHLVSVFMVQDLQYRRLVKNTRNSREMVNNTTI
jgi:DNA-binding CsgD family transcriptional regulator